MKKHSIRYFNNKGKEAEYLRLFVVIIINQQLCFMRKMVLKR